MLAEAASNLLNGDAETAAGQLRDVGDVLGGIRAFESNTGLAAFDIERVLQGHPDVRAIELLAVLRSVTRRAGAIITVAVEPSVMLQGSELDRQANI